MPQVYLPQGYNAVNPDGVINGHDVTLAFHDANRRTTLRTLGRSRRPARCRRRVHASRTSSVRSTSVRTTRKPVTTDTRARRAPSCSKAVSSAADFANNAAMIDNIGGQIQKIGASGSIDQAGTAAELAQLKSQPAAISSEHGQ
jgi:filamentous hemagglutinin